MNWNFKIFSDFLFTFLFLTLFVHFKTKLCTLKYFRYTMLLVFFFFWGYIRKRCEQKKLIVPTVLRQKNDEFWVATWSVKWISWDGTILIIIWDASSVFSMWRKPVHALFGIVYGIGYSFDSRGTKSQWFGVVSRAALSQYLLSETTRVFKSTSCAYACFSHTSAPENHWPSAVRFIDIFAVLATVRISARQE